MKMKSLLAGLAGIALLLGAAACGGGSGGDSSGALRLALEKGNFDELPDWIAIDNGYYKDEGLKLKVSQIDTGVTGIKTLIGGKVELATAGGTGVVQADAAGGNVKFVGGLLQTTPYVVAAKPGIKTMADLKGKTFAVSQFGSSSDGAARAALTAAGLKPDKDVRIVQLGNNSQRLAGVASGSVAATVLSPDQTGSLEQSGLVVVQNLAELNLSTVHLSVATTDQMLKSHPKLAGQVRAALSKALAFIQDPANKDAVLKTIAKWMQTKVTDSATVSTYQYYQDTKGVAGVYPPDSKMLTSALQNDIDTAKATGTDVGDLKPQDLAAAGSLDAG
jgi:ABC-type nitrate/sulfonate/bicarbonate transport system substrate-binding protein